MGTIGLFVLIFVEFSGKHGKKSTQTAMEEGNSISLYGVSSIANKLELLSTLIKERCESFEGL